MKKRKNKSHAGRHRLFPPCPRYRSHVFSPTTNRCPCGYQRPGTEVVEKTEPLVPYTFRLPSKTLKALDRFGVTSEVIRKAIDEYLERHDLDD